MTEQISDEERQAREAAAEARRVQAEELARQFPTPASGFHYTLGAYDSGDTKSNGVHPAHLADHIEYNLLMRPGRAFFVDGKCLNTGYLGQARCKAIEQDIAGRTATRCTAPYW